MLQHEPGLGNKVLKLRTGQQRQATSNERAATIWEVTRVCYFAGVSQPESLGVGLHRTSSVGVAGPKQLEFEARRVTRISVVGMRVLIGVACRASPVCDAPQDVSLPLWRSWTKVDRRAGFVPSGVTECQQRLAWAMAWGMMPAGREGHCCGKNDASWLQSWLPM